MMLLPFSACDGILEGIYDSPAASDSNELGFIRTDPSTHSGTIYIDATDYRRWTFIDFHTQKVDSVNVTDSEQKEPEEWDIAVHRYDVKTNAGAVLETGFTGFSALRNADAMPEGTTVFLNLHTPVANTTVEGGDNVRNANALFRILRPS